MADLIEKLQKVSFFHGWDRKELLHISKCLSAKTKYYKEEACIFHTGDHFPDIGIILGGGMHIIQVDSKGNKSILMAMTPGNLFGEMSICDSNARLSADIYVLKNTELLFIDVQRIINGCKPDCPFYVRVIHNLISLLAESSLLTHNKLQQLSQRSTRDKLISYLSERSEYLGTVSFDIPFTQQELADYLSVNRSALSVELNNLRKEGCLNYSKKHYTLFPESGIW